MPQPNNLALPPQELIDLVISHQGVVSRKQLLRHFSVGDVARFEDQLLVPAGDNYTLRSLPAFVDGLILVQWALPEGIIGKVSALLFHGLSVALPINVDVCLPDGWGGQLPPSLGITPFTLPAQLREYGVEKAFPTLPGTIPIKIFSPAPALAQVWADPQISEETKRDCWYMYEEFYEEPAARALRDEAFERYQLHVPATARL